MRQTCLAVLTFASCLLISPAPSYGVDLLLDFPQSEGNSGLTSNVTIGFSFSVSNPIVVDSLMVWDQDNDGLSTSVGVGLWNSNGSSTLATTTIPSGTAASAVVSTSGMGSWRYVNITPVSLTSGTYVLGALFLNNTAGATRYNMVNKTLYPGVTYLESRSLFNGPPATLGFPVSEPGIPNGSFGPNLGIQAVPEPGSVVLAALAAGTVLLVRKRRGQ